MPRFNLPNQIRFCDIGEQRVFVDVVRDRYFSLPPSANLAFTCLLNGAEPCPEQLEVLLALGLLVQPPAGSPPAPTSYPEPEQSLLEQASGAASPRTGLRTVVEVWRLVAGMRHLVSAERLAPLLAAPASAPPSPSPSRAQRDLQVRRFLAARRLVPAQRNCLSDSLALHHFLRRRGIRTDLVVGAKLHPFAAHCWVQDGSLVLNDFVGTARNFAPILVA